MEKQTQGYIIVFSSASGAGKSTILSRLRERNPQLQYSISATTRTPRDEEKDGVDYFFMSEEDFSAMVKNNGFIEWAQVHGKCYGTPKAFIEKQLEVGAYIVMDADVQGKVLIDGLYSPDVVVGIFIEAPSMAVLEQRLRGRGTESEESIRLRLENARKEIEFSRFEGKYDYYIVNDDLDATVEKIERIIRLLAER